MAVAKWLFQTWLFAISTRKCSFALFCALLRPFALFCGLAFALFFAHLRSFARICVFLRPTAFRTTAVCELQTLRWGNFPDSVPCSQRAENGGVGSIVIATMIFAFLGHPDFPSRGPKTLSNNYLGTSGLKSGRPKNAKPHSRPSDFPQFGSENSRRLWLVLGSLQEF